MGHARNDQKDLTMLQRSTQTLTSNQQIIVGCCFFKHFHLALGCPKALFLQAKTDQRAVRDMAQRDRDARERQANRPVDAKKRNGTQGSISI